MKTAAVLALLTLLTVTCCDDGGRPLLLSVCQSRVRVTRITVRWFKSRVSYGGNTMASRQMGRLVCRQLLILAGDIELNPGPGSVTAHTAPPAAGTNAISVYHANVRSLKKQLGDLRACAPALERHDVVAFSETWLNDTVATPELELGFDQHTWFRRDRGSLGGGVACAVRTSLLPLRLPDPADTEMLLVRLRSASVTLAVCYRPPNNDGAMDRIAAALSAVQPLDCRIVVVGDFNLPELHWSPGAGVTDGAAPDLRRVTSRAAKFVDMCDLLGLKQWVCQPTRGDNILDLVLTRRMPAQAFVRDGLLVSDHRETIATLSTPVSRRPVVNRRTALNYKRADFDGLRRSLSLIPWGLLDDVGADEAVDTFYTLLESAIADHVPTVILRRRLPPWFDGAVRTALRLKEAAFRRLRRDPGPAVQAEFADKRRAFKSVSSSKYFEYLRKLTDDFKTNPKRYWSFLKCITKKSSISPVLYSSDRALVSDDLDRADSLNNAFAAKFTDPLVRSFPEAPAYPIETMSQLHVSESDVRAALAMISPNKACGTDDISARIIIECTDELVVPLTKICNLSVMSGVFPERWKRANIIPLFKKGDKKEPSNYRSVSLLPLFGKVLERVVFGDLFRHVSPVLSQQQHGFIPRRSCSTNLSVYLKHAWEAISDGYQTDVIYTDYTSAFQSVNHALLIHKLKNSYHLEKLALKWFVSYLSDRRQRVIVNGKTSDWKPVISGVPEGSLLAPLLFSMFINDLPCQIESGCLLYADDVKIFRKIISSADGLLLQKDLSHLAAWSVRWGLTLNPTKCKSFTMTLRRAPVQTKYFIAGTELKHVGEIRDLGVTLDTKLTFAPHVSDTVRRANRALGLLIRSFQVGTSKSKFNRSAVLAAYFANVRSILEYCSVVWAGAANSHTMRVDRVQHKFLIWMMSHTSSGQTNSLSYGSLLLHFKIPSLAQRRVQHDMLFLRNVVRGRLDSQALLNSFPLHVPPRSTRTLTLFAVPRARVRTIESGMFCRIPKVTNFFLASHSNVDIFHDSFGVFRAQAIRYILTV